MGFGCERPSTYTIQSFEIHQAISFTELAEKSPFRAHIVRVHAKENIEIEAHGVIVTNMLSIDYRDNAGKTNHVLGLNVSKSVIRRAAELKEETEYTLPDVFFD
jgi:hypothetical protein